MIDPLILITLYPTVPITLLFLIVTLYYDLRTREIPFGIIVALLPGVILSYVIYLLFYGIIFGSELIEFLGATAVSGILVATTFILAKKGQVGFGDVIITGVVGLANPYIVDIPFLSMKTPMIFLVFVFGITYVLAEIIGNIIHNVRRVSMFKEATEDCSNLEKIYYIFIGKVFTREEFSGKRFYFPLLHGGGKRKTAKVGIEPLEGHEFEIEGKYVIAVKGFAFTGVLALGYILTIIYIVLAVTPTC